MDPNSLQPPVNPGNNELPSQPPARKPIPKKFLFIGIGLLVLIFVIVGLLVSSGGKKQTNSSGRDASVYVTREGYEDENDSIGDATAITASLSDKTISFAGTQVVQPCALVTLDDLKDNKLLLMANSLTGPVERNFYDGRGSQQVGKLSDYLLPSDDKVNSCSYSLKNQQTIDLEVLQSFSASAKALNDEITEKYTALPDASGLKIYKSTRENTYDKNESTYMVRAANATVRLRINTEPSVKDKMLALVAERLKKAETSPTPLTTFTIKSPVMDGSVFTSCDILSDDAFKRVVGVEANPLTKERFASSIGVIQDLTMEHNFNYSSYDCRRTGVDGKGALIMNTTTYETVEAAKSNFEFAQSPNGLAQNIQPVTPAIGDESFFGDPAALNNSLVFRKGRLIVYVSYESVTGERPNAQQRINALRPVLEAGTKTINGF